MTSTAVSLPTNIQLPAHLMTAEAAAEVAAANANAAGGIRIGGYPKISIEGGKFHEIDASIDGGSPRTYMVAAQAGQPPLPMMCLEAVIVDANPALTKTFYAAKWQKGSVQAPDCKSSNGIVPDADIAVPQSPVCATCPQNQWGSKISEATGKEVKACTDQKQMVILPGADLNYKALGLAVTPSALGDWGKYVKALSDRNIPVNGAVTNITFDHTASYPKLQFAFNRFLTAVEHALVKDRAKGDDVRLIISPKVAPAAPQLAKPAPAAPALPPPAPVAPPPPPPAAPIGFGAAAAAPVVPPSAQAPAEAPPARKRAPRAAPAAPVAPTGEDLSYLPPAIQAAAAAMPAGAAREGMIAQFAHLKPAQAVAETPVAPPPPPAAPAPSGFGAAQSAPASAVPSPTVVAAGASLKELLQKKLGIKPAGG